MADADETPGRTALADPESVITVSSPAFREGHPIPARFTQTATAVRR
jgi:hypothetical protein